MKRILAFVLVVLIMVGTLWGCQKSESQTTLVPGLSDERAHEIQLALYDYIDECLYEGKPDGTWYPWFNEGYGFGISYLDSAEGYDFVYFELEGFAYVGETEPVLPTLWIGETDFYGISDKALWAYKDGKLYPLKDLYDQGLVSATTVSSLKPIFTECYEEKANAKRDEARWYEDWGDYVPPERE